MAPHSSTLAWRIPGTVEPGASAGCLPTPITLTGKYGLVVKNKYGSEISDFTVSVFIPEEEARSVAEEPQKGTKKAK